MNFPTGRTKIQQPKAKSYTFAAIPKPIELHLDVSKGNELGWLGLSIGTESANKDIAICFIVDKTIKLEDQIERILKLLE